MQQYTTVLKKYAEFSGRASRNEYWMFVLFNFIISFGIGLLFGILSAATKNASLQSLGQLYSLAVFLPSLAVQVRRMHDTNHNGWFILIPIYGFILAVTAGDKAANKYGPDPWAASMGQTPQAPMNGQPMPMSGVTPISPTQPVSPEQPVQPVQPPAMPTDPTNRADQPPQNPVS